VAVVGTAEILIEPKLDGTFEKKLEGQLKGATGASDKLSGSFVGLQKEGLGVGKALGLAGAAGGALLASNELIKFVGSSIEASSALHEQRNATEVLFEAQSKLVESFAESASAIGFSTRAALEATNTFGGFFQNLGLTDEAAAKLGIGFTALAAEIASLEDIPVEQAQQRLISGLRGELDALQKLNVTTDATAVSQRAMQEQFGKTADEISEGEKVFTRGLIILEQTEEAQGNLARTSDSLANTQRRVNAEFENSKARFGDAIVPIVNEATQAFSTLLESINGVFTRIDETAEGEEDLFRIFGSGFGFRSRIDGRETNAIEKARDLLLGYRGEAENATDTTDELAGATNELNDAFNRQAIATDKVIDNTEKAADARLKLNRAIADSERNVARAELTLARAFEDASLRVDDAEQTLAEAIEDRADRIRDAEQRVTDERLQGFRTVRSARERLADFEIDSERKVIDAEQRILDLRRQQARAVVSSLIDVASAQRAGDAEAENRARIALSEAQDTREIADAEAELVQEKADRDLEQDRLERDLFEARMDRRQAVKEAQLDLARTIEEANERIADAERGVAAAHRESSRAIFDAQRGVNDAMREGAERVDDARKAWNKYTNATENARTAVQLLKGDVDLLNESLNKVASSPAFQFSNSIYDAPHRALGGPVNAGQAYLTGERGPELVVPSSSGTVVSNDQLVSVLRRMVEGRQPSIGNMTVMVPHQDPQVLANELAWRLVQGVS
jgi:hypothetical protein